MPGLDSAAISRIGASYGFISVALGAFGSHALQRNVTDPGLIKTWETASRYMLFHGIALVAISAHPRLSQKRIAAGAMALGTLFFSGSLYALVLLKSKGKSGAQILGPVTPLGGLIMLGGWAGLIL